jgi:hypothetical protein
VIGFGIWRDRVAYNLLLFGFVSCRIGWLLKKKKIYMSNTELSGSQKISDRPVVS